MWTIIREKDTQMSVFFVKRYSRKVRVIFVWQVIFLTCAKSDIAPLVQTPSKRYSETTVGVFVLA